MQFSIKQWDIYLAVRVGPQEWKKRIRNNHGWWMWNDEEKFIGYVVLGLRFSISENPFYFIFKNGGKEDEAK